MRTGLVVVGAALAVIGGGLFFTLFVISGGPASTTRLSFDNPDIPGHVSWPEVIARSTTSSASISLVWSTNAPANVSLTPAGPCNSSLGVCPIGPPLFTWTQALSGKESGTSANASAFILVVANPGTVTLEFTGTVSVGYTPGSPLPPWAWGLIALGGVVLLAMGGIALFLGLFLPGGVYRDPPGSTMRLRPPPDPPDEIPPPP
ncbi:MAG TPA: hypothetical protein VEG66_02720 [Thermoplasmata archaeon]|nr:hypothetical protein [Thermoplasmata archaeon]